VRILASSTVWLFDRVSPGLIEALEQTGVGAALLFPFPVPTHTALPSPKRKRRTDKPCGLLLRASAHAGTIVLLHSH
jgi:hypothetical protein